MASDAFGKECEGVGGEPNEKGVVLTVEAPNVTGVEPNVKLGATDPMRLTLEKLNPPNELAGGGAEEDGDANPRPFENDDTGLGAGEPNMGWDDDGKDAIPKLKAAEELPAGAANEKPEGAEAPLEGTAVPLEGFFTSFPPLGAVQH